MASKLTLIRRLAVQQARAQLYEVPSHQLVELPGRPNVVYELRDYSRDQDTGAEKARKELPFLFRPFEVGQRPPPRDGSVEASLHRESTIHEYLDWTVTARPVVREENLDFSGFRVICLLPRLRPNWPAPGAYENEMPKACEELGGPKNPLPCLLTNGKPVCSATVRCGRGYLEIPFFATKESRRGQGLGRCLLEAIEAVARSVGVGKLLLCSTDDENTISTWKHLGFRETSPVELDAWGICSGDLLHMTNTIQMVKVLDEPKPWSSLIIRHKHFVQRAYYVGEPAECRAGQKRKLEARDQASNFDAGAEQSQSSKKPCIDGVHKAGATAPCSEMRSTDEINNGDRSGCAAATADRDLKSEKEWPAGLEYGSPRKRHDNARGAGGKPSTTNNTSGIPCADAQPAKNLDPSSSLHPTENLVDRRPADGTPQRLAKGGGDSGGGVENETKGWTGFNEGGASCSQRMEERRDRASVAAASSVRTTECKS